MEGVLIGLGALPQIVFAAALDDGAHCPIKLGDIKVIAKLQGLGLEKLFVVDFDLDFPRESFMGDFLLLVDNLGHFVDEVVLHDPDQRPRRSTHGLQLAFVLDSCYLRESRRDVHLLNAKRSRVVGLFPCLGKRALTLVLCKDTNFIARLFDDTADLLELFLVLCLVLTPNEKLDGDFAAT